MAGITARHAAAMSVLRCTSQKAFSNLEISSTLSKNDFGRLDASLYTALTHGTLERLLVIDRFIDRLADGGVAKIDDKTLSILRVGVYQLLFTDKIPVSAACDEAVKTATQMKLKSGGFINAVMRRAAREAASFIKIINTLPGHIKYNVSESIYALLQTQYGERADKILEASYNKTPLTLRVNTLQTTVDAVLAMFEGATRSDNSDFGIRCFEPAGLVLSKTEGKAFIQGEGSQYAISALAPKEGQTVVDVCACPGGKSFSAAIEMKNKGKIFSFDLHENKLGLIINGAKELGIDIIQTKKNDGRHIVEDLTGAADCVICDVPCSGLGELTTKPEIRFKNAEDFENLPEIQYAILAESVKYLKPGGRVLYSTCTINKNENEAVVSKFLDNHPNFNIQSERLFLFDNDNEGFYACVLRNACVLTKN